MNEHQRRVMDAVADTVAVALEHAPPGAIIPPGSTLVQITCRSCGWRTDWVNPEHGADLMLEHDTTVHPLDDETP